MEDERKQGRGDLLLVIDAGNTNITFGIFEGEIITHQWRIQSDARKTSDEYGIELEQILIGHFGYGVGRIGDVILSSVVPELIHQMTAMCQRFLKKEPMIVGEGTKTGLPMRVDNPREVGSDRVADAVAGYYYYGGPLVIIDIGTAITHEVISEKGEYLGGSIAPGIEVASQALTLGTSKLPRIELSQPERYIGSNTVEAMQIGLICGYISLIDGITEGILKEMKEWSKKKPRVIATGGFSSLLSANSRYVEEVNRDLNLQGLRLIYLRTKKARLGE